jgi:phosphonate transport system ATP-binding protein
MRIEARNLSARHASTPEDGPDVISGVSFDIASGDRVAIIGPSGAGKTSLLHVLACALKPSDGQLLLQGADPWRLHNKALKTLRGNLFLAPQIAPLVPRQRVAVSVLAGLLPQLTLLQSLRSLIYPSDLHGAKDAIATVDLAEKLFDSVDRLSGGESQRVGLARALISKASLLIIDEPLSALDPQRGEQALASLCNASQDNQATLVATLHQVDMALKFFPRIIGMLNGKVQFDLPTAAVTSDILDALYYNERSDYYNERSDNGTAEASSQSIRVLAGPIFVPACR